MRAPSLASLRLPDDAHLMRVGIRAFLDEVLTGRGPAERAQSWMGFDPEFSRKLGAGGWIGMTLPVAYGGGGLSPFARFVVIEELLAAGAPVSAHWIADRQSAPLILKFGTEDQRTRILPAICRGEMFFCIGMSEPDAGSDLAAIRTTARPAADGWLLSGRKVWTTNAHRAHMMIVLARTGGASERHAGLSQFIVRLDLPGISIRPIRDMSGASHFNEVVFDDVRLSADSLVGQEGDGWKQVTAELAFERSGPERFLSSIELFKQLLLEVGARPDHRQAVSIGKLAARLFALRQMSLGVTGTMEAGEDASWAASCVKDLGTTFEQEIPKVAQDLIDIERLDGESDFRQVYDYTLLASPSFSLRGGTREILRGIIAKGIGLR